MVRRARQTVMRSEPGPDPGQPGLRDRDHCPSRGRYRHPRLEPPPRLATSPGVDLGRRAELGSGRQATPHQARLAKETIRA